MCRRVRNFQTDWVRWSSVLYSVVVTQPAMIVVGVTWYGADHPYLCTAGRHQCQVIDKNKRITLNQTKRQTTVKGLIMMIFQEYTWSSCMVVPIALQNSDALNSCQLEYSAKIKPITNTVPNMNLLIIKHNNTRFYYINDWKHMVFDEPCSIVVEEVDVTVEMWVQVTTRVEYL